MENVVIDEIEPAPRVDLIECVRRGFRALCERPVSLLAMGFVVSVLAGAAWGLVQVPLIGGLLGFAFAAFIATPLSYGFAFVCLRAVRDEVVEVPDALSVFDHYFEAIVAAAISSALVLVGFALLVVPGIFLLCRFAFVPYLIVEERVSGVDALIESYQRTRGYGWTILGLGICRVFLFGVGLASLGLLVVPAAVWGELSMAHLYHRASGGHSPVDLD